MPPIPRRLQGHPNISHGHGISLDVPEIPDTAYFTLRTSRPNLEVKALLGPDVPSITAGYGGFVEYERPQRRSGVEWVGHPVLRMEINDAVLEGWWIKVGNVRRHLNVQPKIIALNRMATSPGVGVPPPIVKVTGTAILRQDVRWAINNLVFGDAVRTSDEGLYVRQYFSLDLIQVPIVGQVSELAARLAGSASSAARGDYTVKNGDSLRAIALHELGDADKWRDIAELNNIQDTRRLEPGDTLRLP